MFKEHPFALASESEMHQPVAAQNVRATTVLAAVASYSRPSEQLSTLLAGPFVIPDAEMLSETCSGNGCKLSRATVRALAAHSPCVHARVRIRHLGPQLYAVVSKTMVPPALAPSARATGQQLACEPMSLAAPCGVVQCELLVSAK